MIINDSLEQPLQSMVDGSWHTTKASLRATYKPSGNKEGVRYEEVGGDKSFLTPKARPKKHPNRKAVRAAVERAFSKAGLGA